MLGYFPLWLVDLHPVQSPNQVLPPSLLLSVPDIIFIRITVNLCFFVITNIWLIPWCWNSFPHKPPFESTVACISTLSTCEFQKISRMPIINYQNDLWKSCSSFWMNLRLSIWKPGCKIWFGWFLRSMSLLFDLHNWLLCSQINGQKSSKPCLKIFPSITYVSEGRWEAPTMTKDEGKNILLWNWQLSSRLPIVQFLSIHYHEWNCDSKFVCWSPTLHD